MPRSWNSKYLMAIIFIMVIDFWKGGGCQLLFWYHLLKWLLYPCIIVSIWYVICFMNGKRYMCMTWILPSSQQILKETFLLFHLNEQIYNSVILFLVNITNNICFLQFNRPTDQNKHKDLQLNDLFPSCHSTATVYDYAGINRLFHLVIEWSRVSRDKI